MTRLSATTSLKTNLYNRCAIEFQQVKHLEALTTRTNNDDFDVTFGAWSDIKWTSPEIWDATHQSFIQNVRPVAVHSHNDYTRRLPLWEALGSGCTSVEADVHLTKSDLLVGHSNRGLNRENSLRAMYLEPLQRLIESRNLGPSRESWNGVFDKVPQQTLVLLIDFKGESQATLTELNKQLDPLRKLDYLTHWNGTDRVMRPLTIVATGNANLADINALNPSHRTIFLDAPLAALHTTLDSSSTTLPIYTYNISNSYYASTELSNAIIYRPVDPTAPTGDDASLGQLTQAAARGLVARYWGSAENTDESVMWRYFLRFEGMVLNADDMGKVRDRTRGMGRLTIQELKA